MTGTRVIASEKTRGGRAGTGCLIAMLVLVGAGVCPADILNPSFETIFHGVPYTRLLPSSWLRVDHPSFNSYCTYLWATEGRYSAGLSNRIDSTVTAGNYQCFFQPVDLTGVGSIEFDVRLAAYSTDPSAEFANFEASFLVRKVVDGIPRDVVVAWRQTAGGVYLNQRVNVSGLTGLHHIEIRNTALVSGKFNTSYWTQWDNLRLVEGSTTIPATVRLEPGILNLGSEGKWITCYIELGEGGDVRTIVGATVTLNGIPAHVGEFGWATSQANDENVADFDGDGILERMVKFDRAAVAAIVPPPDATAMIAIKGQLMDGTPVESDGMAAKGQLAGGVPVEFDGAAVLRILDKDAKRK